MTQRFLYWETTTNNNSGELADLNNGLYEKSMHRFYYTPQTEEYAEQLYPVLILGEQDKNARQLALNSLMLQFPDNPLVQDFWFKNKSSLNSDDIHELTMQLQTDISSTDKKLMVANYLITHGQSRQAKHYLNTIDDSLCDKDCLIAKSKTSLYYKALGYFVSLLSAFSISVPLNIIINSFYETGKVYIIILVAFFLCKSIEPYTTKKRTDC